MKGLKETLGMEGDKARTARGVIATTLARQRVPNKG